MMCQRAEVGFICIHVCLWGGYFSEQRVKTGVHGLIRG